MNAETVGQYLKRMGIKIKPNWTTKEIYEAYCKSKEQELSR